MNVCQTVAGIFMAAAFLLVGTACSGQDSSEQNKSDNAEAVGTKAAFEGSDELRGKDLGKLRLPDEFEAADTTEVYTFPFEPAVSDEEAENSKAFFRAVFGDGYNDSCWKDEGNRVYSYNSEEGFVSFFRNNCPENYYSGERGAVSISEVLGTYRADADREKTIDLQKGECSIGEICDTVSDFISKAMYPLYGEFEIYPCTVKHIIDDSAESSAEVTCAVRYHSITLEPDFSPLFEVEEREEYKVVTNYVPSHMLFYLDGKDSITFFTNRFGTKQMNAERLDEIIPLKRAVNILLDSLAEYSSYDIEQVALYYCCKNTAPSPVGDEKLDLKMAEDFKDVPRCRFEPTWCFIWHTPDGSQQDIKVNAVTGEITMEL